MNIHLSRILLWSRKFPKALVEREIVSDRVLYMWYIHARG